MSRCDLEAYLTKSREQGMQDKSDYEQQLSDAVESARLEAKHLRRKLQAEAIKAAISDPKPPAADPSREVDLPGSPSHSKRFEEPIQPAIARA
jgi:hypothetical protein